MINNLANVLHKVIKKKTLLDKELIAVIKQKNMRYYFKFLTKYLCYIVLYFMKIFKTSILFKFIELL